MPAGRLDAWPHLSPPKPRGPTWGSLRLAEVEGFSLHADLRVGASDRKGRERRCRDGARPPFADAQFSEAPDGRIALELRKPRQGQTHLSFTPEQLLRRMVWRLPPPRQHLLRCEGVLAPASQWRASVVPAKGSAAPDRGSPNRPQPPRPPRSVRRFWADLPRRVHNIAALDCPRCHGRMRVIAAIHDAGAERRILEHLGPPTKPRALAHARDGPDQDLLHLGLG